MLYCRNTNTISAQAFVPAPLGHNCAVTPQLK